MSESTKGVRTLPPALTFAFAIWFVMMGVRVVYLFTVKEPWGAIRFNLVSEGTGVAAEVLALFGAFELARRLTGRAALGIRLAGIGLSCAFAINVIWGATNLVEDVWKHEWLFKTYDYALFAAWLLVPLGIALAHWDKRRDIAGAVILVSLLTWPPPLLAEAMYSWMPEGKTGWAITMLLRGFRFAVLLAGFAALVRGAASTDRALAATGLRTAAKALWLRVIAAVGVVVLTLFVIAGKGGQGSFEVLKLALITGAVINIIALAQFGIGAARAARGEVADLGRWPLVVGAGAALWATGVSLGQLPWLYKMLYKGGAGFGGSDAQDYVQALSIAMPVVVTVGVAVIAVAISGFAARRGNEELRGHAQAKGAGFVALTLVSIAIQAWMIPKAMKAASLGSFMVLSILAAGAALAGTVMMARLLGHAADALEAEPGLPTASVVG